VVPSGAPITRVTLLVHAPGLDERPVGRGLLVSPAPGGPVGAKALSHLSVKWPWLGQQARDLHGPGSHLLRLSYGSAEGTDCLHDIRVLTGVGLGAEDIVDCSQASWDGSLPPFTPDYRAQVSALARQVAALPGLGVTGAWVAGSGIGAVVAHARDTGRRLVPAPLGRSR